MSVQRAEVHWARYLDGNRRVVLEADHARIVAEMEQAHAAALAAVQRHEGCDDAGRVEGYDAGYRDGLAAAAPRTLTADDPEPAVGSVGLDCDGDAWQRNPNGWAGPADMGDQDWRDVLICFGPVTLIHDGGAS